MKRTGFFRRWSPLKRGAPPKRHKRLNPINRKRRARAREAAFGPQADLCRSLPCACCGAEPGALCRVDPHHEPTRARGGLDPDTCPLCWRCHHLRHHLGLAEFEKRTGCDVFAAVDRARELLARGAMSRGSNR